MNIQLKEQIIEILKWVGVVFAAGFIGYFGRYLSMLIIDRVHRKKAETAPVEEDTKKTGGSEADESSENKLKLEKKRLKLEKKKMKKTKD